MRIEKIEPSRHVQGRYLVWFADGTLLKVTEQEMLDFALCVGRELGDAELASLRDAAGSSRARARAASIIGARALSRRELEKRLVRKGETAERAAEAADWLEDIGALDDRAYAASVVRHYAAMGYGPAKMRDELYRRGVPRELWEEALEEQPDAAEAIERYIAAKLRGGVPDEKMKKRISDGLRRRGFRWEDISEALHRMDSALTDS